MGGQGMGGHMGGGGGYPPTSLGADGGQWMMQGGQQPRMMGGHPASMMQPQMPGMGNQMVGMALMPAQMGQMGMGHVSMGQVGMGPMLAAPYNTTSMEAMPMMHGVHGIPTSFSLQQQAQPQLQGFVPPGYQGQPQVCSTWTHLSLRPASPTLARRRHRLVL